MHKTIGIAFLALFALLMLGGCSKPPDEKMLYGTWVSEKAQAGSRKMVNTPSGFKQYANISDTTPVVEGTGKIISAWTDSEGALGLGLSIRSLWGR